MMHLPFEQFRRILGAGVCLILFAPHPARPQACGTGAVREAREASLGQAGNAVLNAIEKKDTERLIGLVGHVGLSFGVDKKWFSRAELRSQFAHEEGAYCLFFSTTCIPEMGRIKGLEPDEYLSQWKVSYSEWLRLNAHYTTNQELVDDGGVEGCEGDFFAQAQSEVQNAPNEIELDFYFAKGRWWFANTVEGVP